MWASHCFRRTEKEILPEALGKKFFIAFAMLYMHLFEEIFCEVRIYEKQ